MRSNLSATEESAVEALDGVLAALHTIKFEIDIALGICVERDVDNMSILFLTLGTNIIFELLDPDVAIFSVVFSA